jgi:hypothetical protein
LEVEELLPSVGESHCRLRRKDQSTSIQCIPHNNRPEIAVTDAGESRVRAEAAACNSNHQASCRSRRQTCRVSLSPATIAGQEEESRDFAPDLPTEALDTCRARPPEIRFCLPPWKVDSESLRRPIGTAPEHQIGRITQAFPSFVHQHPPPLLPLSTSACQKK